MNVSKSPWLSEGHVVESSLSLTICDLWPPDSITPLTATDLHKETTLQPMVVENLFQILANFVKNKCILVILRLYVGNYGSSSRYALQSGQ